MGIYLPGIKPIFMHHKRLKKDYVANAKKLYYPKIPSAEIHTIRIGDSESDLNSSNEKIKEEYISLNTFLATIVYVVKFNQTK